MAQTLLLGLGGTGSRVVNFVAADLKKNKININDGHICCTVLDTNENDRKKIRETGVGVPVVATSKDRIIEDYLKMYSNKGVRSWMPESPSLLKESMKDGAGQMRTKSRLAFMDTIEDRTIHQLETEIDKLFDNRDGTKIRVMVVSSLAGGTGSGMFIQVALWLRKYFARRRCSVTIRGIFLLPDVFINTIEDIRTDDTEIMSLYANAYGAIRELNAITKIKTKGMHPLLPVKIDDLFDSENGQPDGQPVYDYAFFVDDISEGGSVLTQMTHYEKVVANLVYMQLYAPMHDDLYSEEDNLFKRFQKSSEPVFGSCGTAKAVYPAGDVVRYCALRATQDSLSTGWKKIDDEIKDKQRKEAEKEKAGTVLSHKLSPRAEYIRLFDAKCGKDGTQVGSNKLFQNIANDIKNEARELVDGGEVVVTYTDKVEDFTEVLEEMVAKAIDTTDPGNLSGLRLKKNWLDQTDDTKDSLTSLVEKKNKDVKRFIDDMDASVDAMADELLDVICPSDMGDVNQANLSSIIGFLTKKDNNDETYFVHPIAVRYLLYKLSAKLDEIKGSIVLDTARQCAERGHGAGKPKISFDNPKTKTVEDDAIAYLNSKTFLQNEDKFIKEFKSLYAQHNGGQFELCRAYAISSLKLRLAIVLSQRLEKLIEVVEGFFKNLTKVSNTIDDALAENIRKNNQVAQKTIYVCASEEDKSALYDSLRFDTSGSDASINGIIVNAFYGQFCSKENPDAENNAAYKDKSIETIFYQRVVDTYGKLLIAKNKEDIDLDIYTAICKSADIEYEKNKEKLKEQEIDTGRLDVDLETGESIVDDSRHQRHVEAMNDMSKKLFNLGAPFLISDNEQPEDASENLVDSDDPYDDDEVMFTPIKKRKTFWGFNPAVSDRCPELATILGVNVDLQKNSAYPKNELSCYRAVYGIQAGYVEKFNELKNGEYYRNYRHVVRQMINGVGAGHPEELIHTPHIDKTWHLFLPYITPEKQNQEDSLFYRMFWIAMAYGMITIGANGRFQIARIKKNATGSYEKNEDVIYNNAPVGKNEILKLLSFLKLDGEFLIDAKRYEEKFKADCERSESFAESAFLRGKTLMGADEESTTVIGGLANKEDFNAVTVIAKYHNTPRHSDDTTAMLIQSLEKLCCELVKNNFGSDEDDKVKAKCYELCKVMYVNSSEKGKDIELINHWKYAWS